MSAIASFSLCTRIGGHFNDVIVMNCIGLHTLQTYKVTCLSILYGYTFLSTKSAWLTFRTQARNTSNLDAFRTLLNVEPVQSGP